VPKARLRHDIELSGYRFAMEGKRKMLPTLPKIDIDAMTTHAVRALRVSGIVPDNAMFTDEMLQAAVRQKLCMALTEFADGPFAID
jgi:hypothetical protein